MTDAAGILLVRDGCYSVQAHELGMLLRPGAKLLPVYHVCGEVLKPAILLADAIAMAGTCRLPDGVKMFLLQEPKAQES